MTNKTIKVTKPDGQTQTYFGTFDPEKRVITTSYGTRVSPGANDSIEEGPGSCFVATAVYGGENMRQVRVLRAWRDTVIVPSGRWGQSFARFYDWIGPYGSRLIQRFPRLQAPMRYIIDRVVKVVERQLQM